MKDIEEQLRHAAIRSGRSTKALADESGLCYQTVHGFLWNDRQITLRSGAKLARVLGLALKPKRRHVKKG